MKNHVEAVIRGRSHEIRSKADDWSSSLRNEGINVHVDASALGSSIAIKLEGPAPGFAQAPQQMYANPQPVYVQPQQAYQPQQQIQYAKPQEENYPEAPIEEVEVMAPEPEAEEPEEEQPVSGMHDPQMPQQYEY